jgi:molybdenum cofactor biosynthesis enzyme MoaA
MISSITPRELKIEITDACNLHCTFCYLGEKTLQGKRFMPDDEVQELEKMLK